MAKGLKKGFVLKLVALVFLCMMVNWPQGGEAAVNCNDVEISLAPCLPYIKGTGDNQQCCPNVQSLVRKSNAGTTADRQATCNCLKILGSKVHMTMQDYERANKLPGHCQTSLPYAISPDTDCSRVR